MIAIVLIVLVWNVSIIARNVVNQLSFKLKKYKAQKNLYNRKMNYYELTAEYEAMRARE